MPPALPRFSSRWTIDDRRVREDARGMLAPGPSCVPPGAAAQTRMVSVARIRLGSWESARAFKGIVCDDVSEFESYMPSQPVWSLWAMSRRSEREIIVEGTKIRACGREILKNEALSVLLHARLFI